MSAARVRDDAHALAVASELADRFRPGACARDAERRLPVEEVRELAASGLLAVTVPRSHGGAQVTALTLARVVRVLAAADASIGQVPQNHFWFLEAAHQVADERQKRWLYGEVLEGKLLGNAAVPARGPDGSRLPTRLVRDGDGWLLSGTKSYSTGALFADWVPVAVLDADLGHVTAFVPRSAEGLVVLDDWDAIGQRTTSSGTVLLRDVRVRGGHVLPQHLVEERPSVFRALGLLLHASIDVGIAQAALRDAAAHLRGYRRGLPGGTGAPEPPVSEDPVVIQRFGELAVLVRSADALLEAASRTVDAARATTEAPDAAPEAAEAAEAEAMVAMAAARAQAHTAALTVSSEWFDLAGASAVVGGLNLDRHWRDARTHTLHDPRLLKVADVGDYDLNQRAPARQRWTRPAVPAQEALR